jgi:hypothetical protein
MLLEAETNKYCPGGYDIGAISNLITWVLNFFLSVCPLGDGKEQLLARDYIIMERLIPILTPLSFSFTVPLT